MVIKQEIQLTIDQAAAKRIESRLEAIKKEQFELAKAFNRGESEVDDFKASLSKLDSEARQLNSTLDKLEQPRRLDIQSERFDAVSRDVALAGDVGSNAATIGSVLGGAGGQAVGRAGEFAEVVEALPRLKEAVAGMPQTIKAAADALGTSTLGFGAAAVAVVGLGVAIQALQQRAEEAREAVSRNVENIRSEVEIRAEAARITDEAQQDRLEQAKLDVQIAQDTADAISRVNSLLRDTVGGLADAARQIFNFDFPEISAYQDELDDANAEVEDAQRVVDAWTRAIEENINATVDAQQTTQQTQSTTQDIAKQVEEAQARYNDTLNNSKSVSNDAEQAARQAQQAQQAAANAQRNYSDTLRDIAQQTADARKDLSLDTARQFEDLRTASQDADLDAERDYWRDLAQIRDDARKDQRDAVRTRDFAALALSREAQSEALQERLQEYRFEGEQRLIEAQQQARDILREEKRKGDDLRREAHRQRRNANQDLQDFYRDQNTIQAQAFRSSLNIAQQWAQGFTRTMQSAFASASAGGAGAGAASGGGTFEDMMRELARG